MQSKQHFHLRDIILLALIGIIFAVIYFGADFIYNALTVALSPIGYGPAANDITMGIWCMAGTLSGFLLRKPGAGFLGEFLAAAIETFMNGQWGAANFISGFVQGVATELGFTVTGYKIYNWLTVVTTYLPPLSLLDGTGLKMVTVTLLLLCKLVSLSLDSFPFSSLVAFSLSSSPIF